MATYQLTFLNQNIDEDACVTMDVIAGSSISFAYLHTAP